METIRHALNHRDRLTPFLGDDHIDAGYTLVECSIRASVLSRKSTLSAGSDAGGAHGASVIALGEG